jgi:hypothetical protein
MREHDPVLRQPGLDGKTPIWFLTRYDDVVAMLLDDVRFVLDPALALTPEELEAGSPSLRIAVPPDALRYRPVPLFRSLASLPVAW